MRAALIAGAALFVAGIAVALVQLWFLVWSVEVFFKLEVTLGGLFLIAIALWFTRKEYKDFKRQHTDMRLDE